MNDEPLLSIGQFARLARLSVKQLRHYADLGVLPPARVDPATGYRYYRAGQAPDALTIGLLRSLDVPLPVVAEVLRGEPTATGALTAVHDRLEGELARRRHSLTALEHILERGLPSAETAHVALHEEGPQRVVLVREVATSPYDIARATSRCVARLLPLLSGEGPPRLTGLFPLDMEERVPIAVGAALEDGATLEGGALEDGAAASEPAAIELLPGGTFARATHLGPYAQIPLTAHALLAWCAEHGHAPAGPLREVYVDDPATTPPDQLVTHLMVPVREREAVVG
ncbi:MerR family transcriptional regulator [Streptomyces spirodelae]|uniref:MerR family transcriptional regulator n=1 Tax=Streptomyces spirodelae TaxID=2812904 RepID=UPI0027DBFA93|nr:MerR family transcriptional regulator [Streptomyces spirodelae]